MVALDIDGTIMNSRFEISERVQNTIKKALKAGIYVVLATGRMYSATVPIASGLGITTPLITYQGSMVREFRNSDEILLHHVVSAELSKRLISELRKFNAQINIYLDDELFVEDESHILVEYARRRHIVYHKVESFDKVVGLKPTKILAIENNPQKATEMRDYLRGVFPQDLYITKSTPYYCEIVNSKASKGKAIHFLADRWGIKGDEIMAIGDQDNDKEMLSAAGLSVAMGNGDDGLKKLANYVTDTVDNDGAALAIEKFILE